MKPVPPRLDVLLASEAPVGLVFRRGPTKLVRVFRWNRARDTFRFAGQRFQGRIDVGKSDLSPDGRHLIYFAVGGVAWAIQGTGGTWTAISQAPSLKAMTLWSIGGTRGGTGMFNSNHSYWVDIDPTSVCLRDHSRLRREEYRPKQTRMQRDGWTYKRGFEKQLRSGWVLRHARSGYELEQPLTGVVLSFPDWEWAEWDRNRLVWAERGLLRTARLGSQKLGTIRTLHDFNEAAG